MLLGGGGLAALLARLDLGEVVACRKAKKSCKRDKQCCFGRCRKGRCRGNAEPAPFTCEAEEAGTPCGDGCFCLPTVSGGIFCGDFSNSADCFEDADCLDDTGPGSVCFFNKDGNGSCAAPCADSL
jgi:hypothetical protein